MKKAIIIFLCIIIASLSLSAYAHADTSLSLPESEANFSESTQNSLPYVDASSDMYGVPYEPMLNNLENNYELEQKLTEDYYASYEKLWGVPWPGDIKIEEVIINNYVENIGGCDIAFMPIFVANEDMIHTTVLYIADYEITTNLDLSLLVHYGSEFYKIEDVYEKGILTKENVYEIGKLVEEHGKGKIN